jgi:hypothetical protein
VLTEWFARQLPPAGTIEPATKPAPVVVSSEPHTVV